jgi:hypothetical protein
VTKLVRAMLCVCLLAALALPAAAQRGNNNPENQPRSLQGQVTGGNDAPLDGAVVYLKNTRTLAVRSYISGQDGNYHFSGLAQNVDFEIYAEKDGQKSDTKTLSGFDSRTKSTINLKVPVGKK